MLPKLARTELAADPKNPKQTLIRIQFVEPRQEPKTVTGNGHALEFVEP